VARYASPLSQFPAFARTGPADERNGHHHRMDGKIVEMEHISFFVDELGRGEV
jgi:hypothetical protein